MKGFILSVRKAGNENAIATILSRHHSRTYYRFYGARHSILQLGNLIDFEVEGENGRFLPRLRSLSHIGFPWLFQRDRLMLWHNFVQKFDPHLKETEEIDPFYFELLLQAAVKWEKQNPKRIICESYLRMLEFEGRLSPEKVCFVCETPIGDQVALMQAFKPAHPHCIYASALPSPKIFDFFKTGRSVFLDDHEVDLLYHTVMKGF